ncbi:MAG: MOSC domain-containing protein [Deltaproteobacteria bacterium]|nr:MOSC domain-containing protein [Deltaproteobacteria bacterium]
MIEATVEAICISNKKGIVKRETEEVFFENNWGIEQDAHAGKWHRQVSLLAGESIDRVKEKLPTLKNGAFAENIITRDIDLTDVKIGDQLHLGKDVILEITQIGKKCHNDGCAIKKATGDCIMPKEGLFARVISGGSLQKGDVIRKSLQISS